MKFSTAPTRAAAPACDGYSATIDHPFFTLKSGETWHFIDAKHNASEKWKVEGVKVIDGKPALGLWHESTINGAWDERTTDYFTAKHHLVNGKCVSDIEYLGEKTTDHQGDTSGTFYAGKGGSKGGLFLPAIPKVDEHYVMSDAPKKTHEEVKVAVVKSGSIVLNITDSQEQGQVDFMQFDIARHFIKRYGLTNGNEDYS